MYKNSGYLEVCIGPMFAGKTTYLLDLINSLEKDEKNFTVIKPLIDTRYDKSSIVSHNKKSHSCITVDRLGNIDRTHQTIIIDEGHFFPDLVEQIKDWLTHDKKIYVCGLSGDSNMEPIGTILDLIPLADNVIYKQSICECTSPASFSSRINKNDLNQVCVAGSDVYVPTCRKCFI